MRQDRFRSSAAVSLARLVALAAIASALACGNNREVTSAPAEIDGGSDAGAASCVPAPGDLPSVISLTPTISATLRDEHGKAIASSNVSITGLNLVASACTSLDGSVTVRARAPEENPAFVFGDGHSYGQFSLRVTASGSLGTLRVPALPLTGARLIPGATASSGTLSLAIAANAAVNIDPMKYGTIQEQELRAAPIAAAQAPVDQTLGLELLYGVAPLGATICPPAKATVANSLAWAAGTRVDFYGLGNDVAQTWAPFAGWVKLSSGQVSSDGLSISTDDGAGLPVLLTLGLKRQ